MPPEQGTGHSLAVDGVGGDPVRILHVEDDPDVAAVTAAALERELDASTVTVETDPAEGLERLDDERVDCIVSDYQMPEMDGLTFLDEVRAEYPDLPFVLFTGEGSEAIASEAISAGVTDYIQKGTGTEQYELLANRVENAVSAARAREQLSKQEARFRKLIEGASDMVAVLDADGRYEYVSPSAREILGYEPGELGGHTAIEHVHPDDREAVEELCRVASEDPDRTSTVEFRYRHANGEWRVLEATGRNMLEDPDVRGFVVNARDVTERRERERELERYETIIETVSDGVYTFDAGERYTYVNSYIEEMTGYDREELVSEPPSKVLDEAAIERLQEGIERLVDEDDDTFTTEIEIENAAGADIPVQVKLTPLFEDGTYQGHVGVVRDITERKERERELEMYERIVDSAPDAIYVVDGDHRFRVVNENLAAAFDRPKEEIVGESTSLLLESGMIDRDTYEKGVAEASRLLDGDAETYRFEAPTTIGGETFYVENHLSVLTDGGEPYGVIFIVRDVTERHEREQELERQNERLEEFASVVSHDLRNPLNVAMGRLDLAGEDCDSEHLAETGRALDRMDRLIDDILELAQKGRVVRNPHPVQLDALVEDAWNGVSGGADAEFAVGEATILADRDRLVRVFENLFQNAVDHAGPGATVRVGLLDDRGFYVEDDGDGIAADRDRVFDRGYTTSEEGTGFGLSIVREIVEAHGWEISVTDGPSGGARFEVTGVTFDRGGRRRGRRQSSE